MSASRSRWLGGGSSTKKRRLPARTLRSSRGSSLRGVGEVQRVHRCHVFSLCGRLYSRLDAMSQRDHDRSSGPGQARSHKAMPRSTASPVLALQRAIGNRGTTQVLACKGGPRSNCNRREQQRRWIGKKADVDDLIVTTVMGKHSDELKCMSDSKSRIDNIEVQSPARTAGSSSRSSTPSSGATRRTVGQDGAVEGHRVRRREHQAVLDRQATPVGCAGRPPHWRCCLGTERLPTQVSVPVPVPG
jgi:hypothetical protein